MGERMTAREIKWCKQCLMPSSRPRVVFGEDGICNACKWAFGPKKEIDWAERKKEFLDVVDRHRKHLAYDCIVPCSGGKDSATIAHRLKYEFGLNPLAVCYGQLLWTDVGRRNMERVRQSGIDILNWMTNGDTQRKLARRFFIERGHPKQHYDASVNAVPLITAVNFNIPLVIYAEHGETEYGGLVLDEESRRTRNIVEVLEHQVGDDARNWAVDGITERDLYPYTYPEIADIERVGVRAYYFSYFHKWDIYENAKYARDVMGFTGVENPWEDEYGITNFIGYQKYDAPFFSKDAEHNSWASRSDGSFEGFDSIDDCIDDLDYWMMFLKFGFGRASRMASRLIQNGHMTREQGLELVRRYDGEFPRRYLPQICDYLGVSEQEIRDVADKHRNPEIWTQENGEWKLRFPPK